MRASLPNGILRHREASPVPPVTAAPAPCEAAAGPADAGTRLDRFCVARWPDRSRSYLQALIRAGDILVNGAPAKPGQPLEAGDRVTAVLRPREGPRLVPEPMPLPVLHDDPDFLVVDKPPGLPTHPGPGHSRGSLVNGLLALGGAWSAYHADPLRPGIVHRLDRDTSGVIVVARDDRAHAALARQFAARTVAKEYLALVVGVPPHDEFVIEHRIARHPVHRQKMEAHPPGDPRGRAARTRLQVRERFRGFAAVAAFPATGRTHQIRVHLAAAGYPVVADPLYGRLGDRLTAGMLAGRPPARDEPVLLARTGLHARRLTFDHPRTGARLTVEAPVPADLLAVIEALRARGG